MPYAVTSQNTKTMFAESLKKLLAQKPFLQITVTEIIADCGVNRKTFYYHFENTKRLLQWMLRKEVFSVVEAWDLMNDYRGAIVFVKDYLHQNRRLVQHVINSMEREELRLTFYDDFFRVIHAAIVQSEQILSVTISDDFEHFLTDTYGKIVGGLVIDWIYDRSGDEKKLVEYTCAIFNEMLPHMLTMAGKKGM